MSQILKPPKFYPNRQLCTEDDVAAEKIQHFPWIPLSQTGNGVSV